jgi:energy-coupling factor transporter ATP-binding protein EcfA2
MGHLSLVKPLSHLREEYKHCEEIVLESSGLAFARGSIVEAVGPASSGKTSISLSLLAKLTAAGEICAVVDSTGSFDPRSAVLAGVEFENLLWVKCGGELEKAFMSADHLIQAKGFGAIWLNLNGLPLQKLKYVPKTYWYRYRTRIKETPTLLIVTAEEPVTGSASQQSFEFSCEHSQWSGSGRFKLMRELRISMNSRKQFYGRPFKTKLQAVYADA